MSSGSPTHSRAARFPMRLPVRFRPSGSAVWYPGQTENISCSGALIRCRRPLSAYSPLQVVLQLPTELSGGAVVKVVCSAYVSRTVEADQGADGRLAIAAAFVDFRFVREERPEQSLIPAAPFPDVSRKKPLHALNNQLMLVMGNCDLLLMRAQLDDEFRQGLLRIKEAVRRATETLREI